MEKQTISSSSSDGNYTSLASSTARLQNQSYVTTPPSPLQNQHEDQYYHDDQDIANDFSSMYNFIFPPASPLPGSLSLTPSSCSSLSDDHHLYNHNLKNLTSEDVATEHRLNQARLVLEYQQLCDHYDRCFSRLQALIREIEMLRRENSDLRQANIELIKILSGHLTSKAAAINDINGTLQGEKVWDLKVKRWESRNNKEERNSLPKSVSVMSSSYLKLTRQHGSSNQQQQGVNPSLRVYVASKAESRSRSRHEDDEKKAIELDIYNQGMVKTELCNKWQESGTCPYNDRCQFAHGINELRPVLRHPRYKTQVCRMILAGQTCPYGHRCHFRHSLTADVHQEPLLLRRSR